MALTTQKILSVWGNIRENFLDIQGSKIIDVVSELGWGISVVVVDPWADPADIKRTSVLRWASR